MTQGFAKWRINRRRLERTGEVRWHKARVPGCVRVSRMPGGSGFRNHPHYGGRKRAAKERE